MPDPAVAMGFFTRKSFAELQAGAGSASAGLYNAVARGIRIKVVADKASSPPG